MAEVAGVGGHGSDAADRFGQVVGWRLLWLAGEQSKELDAEPPGEPGRSVHAAGVEAWRWPQRGLRRVRERRERRRWDSDDALTYEVGWWARQG